MTDEELTQMLQGVRPQPPAHLYGAVLEAAPHVSPKPNWRRALWPFGGLWQPVTALALIAMLGVFTAPEPEADYAALSFDQMVAGEWE